MRWRILLIVTTFCLDELENAKDDQTEKMEVEVVEEYEEEEGELEQIK